MRPRHRLGGPLPLSLAAKAVRPPPNVRHMRRAEPAIPGGKPDGLRRDTCRRQHFGPRWVRPLEAEVGHPTLTAMHLPPTGALADTRPSSPTSLRNALRSAVEVISDAEAGIRTLNPSVAPAAAIDARRSGAAATDPSSPVRLREGGDSYLSNSAARSPMAIELRLVGARGTVGMMDASTTCRPSTP
jgi:hypothetical protein